jgi:enoyl-CoA hydratase/carnithine racemase
MTQIFKQVPRVLFGKGSISRIKELIPEELQNDILFIVDDSLPELPILNIVNEDRIIHFPARLGEPKTIQIDGICVGAGAIIAMASDMRIATPEAKTAFLFTRVGLAGCDMGACAILPRIIGQSRAAELLYTGRSMSAEEGERWGFYNRLASSGDLLTEAQALAGRIVAGPNFGHMMTKTMLVQEWSMSIEQAIEAEAQAQAICMQTADFERAFNSFVAKEKPVFEGN